MIRRQRLPEEKLIFENIWATLKDSMLKLPLPDREKNMALINITVNILVKTIMGTVTDPIIAKIYGLNSSDKSL